MTTSTSKGEKLEGRVQIAIMLAIGGASGAASFTHVAHVAAAHGQAGWLAWADAVTLELMSLASGLEMRRRKRHHRSAAMPFGVLLVAVALSLSAQILQAEQTPIGWVAAAIPALGFLAMAKMALGRTAAVVAPEQVPHAPPAVPVEAPVSPGTPPAPLEAPEAIAFRQAQVELRRTSRLSAMNATAE